MDAATRAEVEKRATAGNTISGVIATTLLNDNQMARHGKTGGPISVVAVDFMRGVVVIQNGPGQYEPVRFDPAHLELTQPAGFAPISVAQRGGSFLESGHNAGRMGGREVRRLRSARPAPRQNSNDRPQVVASPPG
jgi:hypothetical protein